MTAQAREIPDSFGDALAAARSILSRGEGVGSLESESEQLVLAALRMTGGGSLSRTEFFLRLGDRFSEAAGKKLLDLAWARAAGQPLQYLTGFQVFLDHEYAVGPGVLVPRPETEVLVDAVQRALRLRAAGPLRGLEVGLGSGVISLELLAACPRLRMIATEVSAEAAVYAERNRAAILAPEAVERLEIRRSMDASQVLEPLMGSGPADFLVSNPPYLVAGAGEADADVVRHEPAAALFAPAADPLFFYRKIADGAHLLLGPGGFVALEVPHERAVDILDLFRGPGWMGGSGRLIADLTGRPRVLWVEKSHG